jgi:hypothetical protein
MSSFASPTTNTGLRNRLGASDKPATPTPAPAPKTTPAPATAQAQATPATPVTTANVGYRLPEYVTLQNAIKWAIIEDKPIMMDYWADSLEKKVLIGVKENQEKLLVKSVDEYTSPVVKIFKHNTDFIIMTENSIYLVDSSIDVKRIS